MAGQYIRAVVYNEKHQSIADHLYEGRAAEVIAKPDALHALVNALEGYNPDAVRDVVEALRLLLPVNVANNSYIDDDVMIPVDIPMSELRVALAALARLGGAS